MSERFRSPNSTRPETVLPLNKYSVRIAGHPTSISLEPEFWAAFGRAAARRGKTVGALVTEIDAGRDGGLSSAIRLFVLADLEGGGPV